MLVVLCLDLTSFFIKSKGGTMCIFLILCFSMQLAMNLGVLVVLSVIKPMQLTLGVCAGCHCHAFPMHFLNLSIQKQMSMLTFLLIFMFSIAVDDEILCAGCTLLGFDKLLH